MKPEVHHKGAIEQSFSKLPPPPITRSISKIERDGKLERVENLVKPSLAK
jgi:hypothetical protein